MFNFLKKDKVLARYDHFLMITLRLGLGIIFVWFGVLKLFDYNPVFDLIYHSAVPAFAYGIGLFILGAAEVFIGLILIANRALFFTHILLLFHLLGTFTTFIFGWQIIFKPYFPILSLDGEFVVKNAVLAVSGLVVLIHELRKKKRLNY